jgi:hypothetical protein
LRNKLHKDECKNKNAALIHKYIEKKHISWLPIKIRKNKKKWNSKIPEPKFLLRDHQHALKKVVMDINGLSRQSFPETGCQTAGFAPKRNFAEDRTLFRIEFR